VCKVPSWWCVWVIVVPTSNLKMLAWITGGIFAGCAVATIVALATNVFVCSERGEYTYSVGLFRGCLQVPELDIDECGTLDWDNYGKDGRENKHMFAGMAAFEFLLLGACVAGCILSGFQIRGHSMSGPILAVSAVTGVLATGAWCMILGCFYANQPVIAVHNDYGLEFRYGQWGGIGELSVNFGMMVAVTIAGIVNFCVAWRVYRLAHPLPIQLVYAAAPPVYGTGVYYAVPAPGTGMYPATNNGYPVHPAPYPQQN
jgi:hypothetical protein